MIYKRIYKESKLYAAFLKFLGFERGISRFLNELPMFCPNGSRILDVGCGSGVIGLKLLEQFPGSTLLATDIEKNFLNEMISNSQKRNIDASRIYAGISDINTPTIFKPLNGSTLFLEQNSFDIVSMGAVLGYSKNKEETLKELLSMIKPGGYFINIDMNEGLVAKMVASNYRYRMTPLDIMRQVIENEGFSVSIMEFGARCFPANLTRIGIVGRKSGY